jgi:diguanylate cyclase (GGDEF)-like protein
MGSLNVLMVEHDVECRSLIRHAMRAMTSPRIHLTEVERGRDAIERARQDAYACALLGCHLPDGDGLRFIPDLMGGNHPPAVIMLAPEDDRARALRALAAGAQDFLPWGAITPEGLARAIEFASERHRVTRALEEGRRKIAQVAFLDPLTGVLNRRGLEHLAIQDVRRAARSGAPLMAIAVDCDDLRRVNQRWGQPVADEVLVEIVRRVHRCVRAPDRFARVGGDEFLLVMPDTTEGEALAVAEKIHAAIAGQPFAVGGAVLQATASLSVFAVPPSARGLGDLLAAAQAARFEARSAGRASIARLPDLPDVGAIEADAFSSGAWAEAGGRAR